MNISDHKETAGKTNPEKLKNRIRESLRKSPEKTAKRVKQAGTQSRRARQYAGILSRMVQCDTTSHPYSDAHPAAAQLERYHGYHKLLEELFPLVHEKLEKTDLDGSLLYYWKGKNHERPIVLMGHQDVVPVTDAEWKYPPFSGKIAGGKVWGRGSVDTKKRGVRPWFVCDEGGGIYTDPMPGVRGNFAMIGIGEKGRANVKFIARGEGGHASTPRKNSPIARLAAFVCAVEKHSPFRSEMEPATRAMLQALAPGAVLPFRIALQNAGLFQKPIELVTPRISGQAAAMLGTTITFTMASGSDACNVFPAEATLGANMRFVHHQDMEESLALIRRLAARYKLEMEVLDAAPCTKLADIDGTAFRYVEMTVMKTFPGMRTSPYVLTAATDSAFYDSICGSCIRFAPIVYGPEEKKGIHGTDEALRYDCLPGAVDFYKNLITDNQ